MKFSYITIIIILIVNFSFSQSTRSPQVSKFNIKSPELNTNKTIWLYLPKDYSASTIKYPVIYMHDAQNLFDNKTSFAGEWGVDEFLDSISSQFSIIVGIEHGNEKRTDELTPFTNEKYGGGNGKQYLDFIKNTLKPYIDKNYRTKSKPEHTSLFGSSLGGLMSFYGVIKYPNTFGKAGVFSPSFWINPHMYDKALEATIPKYSKFFFLVGTDESKDMVDDTKSMTNILKNKGLEKDRLSIKIIDGGKHNEKLWGKYYGDAYLWLYN